MVRRIASFAAVLFLGGMLASAQIVTGKVTYVQRMALPPDSVVRVTLEDVTLADVPAKVIAEKTIQTEGKQVPFEFELPYTASDIDSRHHYNVRASIHSGDRLLFTSTDAYPVLTHDAPASVEIMVRPAQQGAVRGDAPLEGTHWTLLSLAGKPARAANEHRLPYIQLESAGSRLGGSTGCNRIIGTYELNGDNLKISPVGTTMMACMNTPVSESAFTGAMGKTRTFSIRGKILTLRDESRVLARFQAASE